jgi:hypothetical protein
VAEKSVGSRRRWPDYLAATGVIVSIAFVGFELRQNTAAVRGATYQDLASTSVSLTTFLASDGEFAELYTRWQIDPGSLNDVERMRVYTFVLGVGRNMENAFQQRRVGTLTDDLWLGYLETWRSLAVRPGFPDYWDAHKARYSSEFREYVDTALLTSAR